VCDPPLDRSGPALLAHYGLLDASAQAHAAYCNLFFFEKLTIVICNRIFWFKRILHENRRIRVTVGAVGLERGKFGGNLPL
jgi:hypothetical protein